MLLKTKFTILLSLVFIGLLLVNLSTLSLVIFPAFEELENREAEKNMGRVINILESDIEDMEAFAYDWSAWDATYNYVKNRNQAYLDANYTIEYALSANHDLYYIWDLEGKPILNKAMNEKGTAHEPFDDFPVEGLPDGHPFFTLDTLSSQSSGLIQTKRGPMIIGARPIIKSSLEGPIRGVLAMGRYLDKGLIENITKRSGLDIDVWSLIEKKLPSIPADSPRDIEPGEIKIIITEDETNSFVYSSYPDIYGNPLILMRVSMPRDIVAQGKSTIKYGIGMALVSGLVLMLVLLFILQRSIIFPLSSLAQNILRLGKKEDVARQFPVDRSDELGMVARSVIENNQERIKAEEKLTVYSKDLKRRNNELKEFTSIASHDLQEPLRKIALFGDRLKEGVSQETQKDYLQRMTSAASRMQILINDLLDLSGIDLFARPFQSVDLEKVVEEVLEDLEVRILEAQATVEVGSLPTLYAEPSQMKQLFQNLIANAIKYHKKGEPSIVILNSQKNDLELWRITVKDNGIGFDEKYSDKILKPFQRLHGRNEYEGTGIGLAICDKIIARHNGHITCKSTLGEGSTFIVSLPEKPA